MAALSPEGTPGAYERLVSRRPLVIARRVRWSDCDPAGVVYTGQFSTYLLDAMGYVTDELSGGTYWAWLRELQVDTPCKGLELDFHAALWPDQWFELHCSVGQIRDHSWDVHVRAKRSDSAEPVFSGRFSPICISRTVRRRVPIPPALREALQQLQQP